MVKVNYDIETKKVLGFYPDFMNYEQIPEPYVEIDDKMHLELVELANSGKELYLDNLKNKTFSLRDITVDTTQATQNRIVELKNLLAETDYQAIKYAEGHISEKDYATIKAQRQAWRDEINLLEEDT